MTKKQYKVDRVPDHVRKGTKEVKQAYKEWTELKEKLHNHPKRWYSTPHREDPDRINEIDLIGAFGNVKKWAVNASEEQMVEIKDDWTELQKIKTEITRRKRIWDKSTSGNNLSIRGLEPYAAEVMELFGQWKSVTEVKKELYERWGYDISANKISKFKTINRDKIDKLRTEWESSYDDFDVARKRGRIERLAFLARTQMDKYQENNSHSVTHSREIRAIIEQIRKEVEGDRLAIDINGNIDVNTTINMNLSVQRLTQKVSINAFVVSLVAAKRGIDPIKLMGKLTTSFYNQYNGFTNMKDTTGEPEYPSNLIQTYDWNEIGKMHERGEVIEYEVVEDEVVEDEAAIDSVKSKMMNMLASKQTELDKISKK